MPQTMRRDRDELIAEIVGVFNLSAPKKTQAYLTRKQLLELLAIGTEYKKHLTGEGVTCLKDRKEDSLT